MKFKQIIAMLLALLCILPLMAGCVTDGPGGEDSGTEEEETSGEETVGTVTHEMMLTKDYAIVRPDSTDVETRELASGLLSSIQTSTGLNLGWETDYRVDQSVPREDAKEIVIGMCDYAETEEIRKTIKYNDYVITKIGSRIFIVAPQAKSLKSALNRFLNFIVNKGEKTDEGVKLTFEDYTYNARYSMESIKIGDRDISEYRIVHDRQNKYKAAAEYLCDTIANACGTMLPIARDTTKETECEIFVGPNSRCDSKLGPLYYNIKVEGSKVYIEGGGTYSTMQAAKKFYANYVSIGGKNPVVKADLKVESSLYEQNYPLTEGADIRIISANILADSYDIWDTTFNDRVEPFLAMLEAYQPDIVGTQEVDASWHSALKPYYGKYKMLGEKLSDGTVNYSTILYNSEKYDVVKQGIKPYDVSDNKHCRNITWAIFKDKTTGQEFGFISTHWNIKGVNGESSPADVINAARTLQAKELAAFVLKLRADNNNIPVFTTGDYNNTEMSTSVLTYQREADLYSSKEVAAHRYNVLGSCHDYGTTSFSQGTIDYVFGTKNTAVMGYMTIVNNASIYISDHLPVMADIKFNATTETN